MPLDKHNNPNGISSFQTNSNGCHVTFIIRTLARALARISQTLYNEFQRFLRQTKRKIDNSKVKKRGSHIEKSALRVWARTHLIICTIYGWLSSFFAAAQIVMWIVHIVMSQDSCGLNICLFCLCVRAFISWTKTAVRLWNSSHQAVFSVLLSFVPNVERRMTSMQKSVYINIGALCRACALRVCVTKQRANNNSNNRLSLPF